MGKIVEKRSVSIARKWIGKEIASRRRFLTIVPKPTLAHVGDLVFDTSLVFGKRTRASLDRPGLQKALSKSLELGKDAAFVVAKLDRLGPNSIEVQTVLKHLTDAGVRVVAIGDGLDSASGMGASILKLLVSILASFAELEREVIRTRLLDGRRRARSERRIYRATNGYASGRGRAQLGGK